MGLDGAKGFIRRNYVFFILLAALPVVFVIAVSVGIIGRASPAGGPGREPRDQMEEAVVHGPDLDPEPSAGHGTLRGTESRHAERHGELQSAGKPGNLASKGGYG